MKRFWDIFRRKPSEPQQPQQPQQPQINYHFVGNPQPAQPVQSFIVDEARHQTVLAILQGQPFFCVCQTPSEIRTTAAIDSCSLAVGIKTFAKEHPTFAEDLLNIVIDIHTQNGTKTPSNEL